MPVAPRALDFYLQVRARFRRHPHMLRTVQKLHAAAHALAQLGRRAGALEDFGMLVADHHEARAAGEDLRQLGRVQHAFHGAIDHHAGRGERLHHRLQAADRERGAGRADRNAAHRRRHELDVERPRAELEQRELGELDQHPARLGLGKNRDHLAGLDLA
jgi:hypothetical protein